MCQALEFRVGPFCLIFCKVKAKFAKVDWIGLGPCTYAKIQQTKMLVTCQRFGNLILFGLAVFYSSDKI